MRRADGSRARKHEEWELRQMQSLSLDSKIRMTQYRIREWVSAYGEKGVYVSFSGGKDSTVLLDIVRGMYRDVPAVFVDTPTQYPELRDFAESFDNVTVLHPRMSFAQVCERYGFPMISKDASGVVWGARKWLEEIQEGPAKVPRRGRGSLGQEDSRKRSEVAEKMHMELMAVGLRHKHNYECDRLFGTIRNKGADAGEVKDWSTFSLTRYRFFLDAPFGISDKCCTVMKKAPIKQYEKETGRVGMTGQMAAESRLRMTHWLRNGCNGFDMKSPISNPMAFWTEKDVLLYIKSRGMPICPVYGEVVTRDEEIGQASLFEIDYERLCKMNEGELGNFELRTTGCHRTGCCLCCFGAHLEKPGNGRFTRLKETHPGIYGLLDVIKNNGVTYREAIEWTNERLNRGRIEL